MPAAVPVTNSRLAAVCAQTVCDAFAEYERRFQGITGRARERFLTRDWGGSFADAAARLRLYTEVLNDLTARTKELLGSRICEHSLWVEIKAAYSSLIANSTGWEIAESFFNSLTRRVFATEGVDATIEFVDTDFDSRTVTESKIQRVYSGRSLTELLLRSLTNSEGDGFAAECWHNLSARA